MPDLVSVISHTTIPLSKSSAFLLSEPNFACTIAQILLGHALAPNHSRLIKSPHSMKEQLRLFWNHTDEKKARRFLAIWCRDAWHSGIKQLADVAKTLASYRTGLLTYFKHRITSGTVEGLVNKIKTLKRQAYGFRDMEYFKLRLYHLHTQRYSLTG